MCHCLSIPLLKDSWLLLISSDYEKTAKNICVQDFVRSHIFNSFGHSLFFNSSINILAYF